MLTPTNNSAITLQGISLKDIPAILRNFQNNDEKFFDIVITPSKKVASNTELNKSLKKAFTQLEEHLDGKRKLKNAWDVVNAL